MGKTLLFISHVRPQNYTFCLGGANAGLQVFLFFHKK